MGSIRAGYDTDFFRWTQETAELLRQGRFEETDKENLAEEVADMGKRDRRELQSRMIVLLMHLMKWAAQPQFRGASMDGHDQRTTGSDRWHTRSVSESASLRDRRAPRYLQEGGRTGLEGDQTSGGDIPSGREGCGPRQLVGCRLSSRKSRRSGSLKHSPRVIKGLPAALLRP